MKKLTILLLVLSLLLCGCGWMDGSYVSVTPHRESSENSDNQVVTAQNYLQLRTALENMIRDGVQSSVIAVAEFRQDQLENGLDMAIRYVKSSYPMGAYAVEDISYEIGTSAGSPAVAVNITYLHNRSEIRRVETVDNMAQARALIEKAVSGYEADLVLLIRDYEITDIHQLVEDYAVENPSAVMETPAITAQTYPNFGSQRILELKFTYQSSRDSLRAMQEQVQRIFSSAALYISHDAEDSQKFGQLYSFLMERFDEYQLKTSITPAYSLLNHGVGDSKTFAVVYAEMCRRAGLECLRVVGTMDGEPRWWNMVLCDGYYYHVDLLVCQELGDYRQLTDDKMDNYVWDYSAYPECSGRPPEEETTLPTEEVTEQTTEPAEEPT